MYRLGAVVVFSMLIACDRSGAPAASRDQAKDRSSPGASAPAAARADEGVLRVVNGTTITQKDVDFWTTGGHGAAATPEGKAEALERVVEAELMYQKGLELGMDKDPRFREAVDAMARRMATIKRREMMRHVYNREIEARVVVGEQEAKAFFDENRERITAEYHLLHLRFGDEPSAKGALQSLAQGKAFEALAAERGASQGRAHGAAGAARRPWDLGFVGWGRMDPQWFDVVSKLHAGRHSDVIAGQGAFHLLQLVATRKAAQTDYPALRPAIINRLHKRKVREAYAAYLAKLRAQAKIVVPKEK